MGAAGWLQAAAFVVLLTALTPPFGAYMARVFRGQPTALDRGGASPAARAAREPNRRREDGRRRRLFVLIGARPRTDWLPGEIASDRRGFLFTGEEVADDHGWPLERGPLALESGPLALETSKPGVLAAGDVRRTSVKRVASAVGEGSIAIQLVYSLLADERPHPGRALGDGAAPAASAGAR